MMAKKPALPEGLSVRPAGWRDLEAVVALMNAVDVAAYGEPDSDRDDVRDSWGDLNLTRDAWVVENQGGDLVGYAAVFPDEEEIVFDFLTLPELEVPALTRYLLARCQRRAHEIRAVNEGLPVRASTIIPHVNRSVREILKALGFQPRRYYFQMQIDLDFLPEPPIWPEGIACRTFRVGADELPVYEIIQNAFDRPGYRRPAFDRWRDYMIGSSRFDPELWFILIHEAAVIGAALCYDYGDLGWIRQLAIAPPWRRQGLGAALLQFAFVDFYRRGRRRIALGVSVENPSAIELYKRVGMQVRRQYDEYGKVLAA